jgi:dTMP kinase
LNKHLKTGSTKYSGLFVSVDGPNGVGKSTLIEAINKNLTQKGLKVHLTKEITSTPIGHFIHKYHKIYHGKTLALLLAADRQNHIENDILPALNDCDIVITDRYVDSSLAFQKLDGVQMPYLWKINEDFLKPHLSIVVAAPENVVASRRASRKVVDRFEESFSCAKEIHSFHAAASFMKKNGFNVFIFKNESVSVKYAAVKLTTEILRVRQGLIGKRNLIKQP